MKQYYIHDGQNQQGPFDLEQLKNAKISKDYMVWCEGMDTWKPAGDVEELKTLFIAVPPPLPKNVNVPPPITPPLQPVPVAGKSKKKGLLWIILGAGLGTILVVALIIFLSFKSCNSSVEKGLSIDSTAVQSDSEGSGSQSEGTPGKEGSTNSSTTSSSSTDKKALEAAQKEEEQKAAYRKNWRTHVYARANYESGPFGIVINPTVTVTNSMPYYVNEVTVTLNYILSTGGVWKTEYVKFTGLGANRSSTKNAPPTDRGTSIQTRVSHISSSSLELYSD